MQAPGTPSTGDKVDLKALNGALLHITVTELIRDIETSFGPADAIRCTVAVLDGDHKGDVAEDALIFPRVLVGQLRDSVGAADPVVLGRLGQGIAKPGKSAPWTLNAPTADDLAVGARYETYAATKLADESAPF